MTVYDQVMYRDALCVVEQVWTTDDAAHTAYCAVRPVQPVATAGGYSGTFFVQQSATSPVEG